MYFYATLDGHLFHEQYRLCVKFYTEMLSPAYFNKTYIVYFVIYILQVSPVSADPFEYKN